MKIIGIPGAPKLGVKGEECIVVFIFLYPYMKVKRAIVLRIYHLILIILFFDLSLLAQIGFLKP
jgi:hypothetical protein